MKIEPIQLYLIDNKMVGNDRFAATPHSSSALPESVDVVESHLGNDNFKPLENPHRIIIKV